jgi:AhpD family alkylhydroperoxidase
MADLVKEFNDYRSKMNEKLLADNNKVIKRIFNVDTNAYMEGALDVKTKELLGLVASAVLRCDDCIKYHLETAYERRNDGKHGNCYLSRRNHCNSSLKKSLRVLGSFGRTN